VAAQAIRLEQRKDVRLEERRLGGCVWLLLLLFCAQGIEAISPGEDSRTKERHADNLPSPARAFHRRFPRKTTLQHLNPKTEFDSTAGW
jgi:hypothetical protein